MSPNRAFLSSNPRMAYALLLSAFVHGLLMLVAPFHAEKKRRSNAAGFEAPLIIRIAGAQGEGAGTASSIVARPSVERRAPEKPARAVVSLAIPATNFETSAADEDDLSAAAPEGRTALAHPGVTAVETLFQRPLPAAFSKTLLDYPGFVRGAELDDPPQPVDLLVPDFPSGEKFRGTYSWIVVAFLVDEQGTVVATLPVTGSEGFENFQDEVVAAMRDSTFAPGRKSGVPVKSISFQMIEFRPQDAAGAPRP